MTTYTDRVIQIGIGFPTKGEGIENKVPGIPLKAKPGATIWRKTDMVIATFIVASGLKTAFVNVTGKVRNTIQRKGEVFDHRLRNVSSWHTRSGLDGSTAIGMTK